MRQICRSLTDCEDGFLKDASHLIVDRNTSFVAMRDFSLSLMKTFCEDSTRSS